MSEQIAGRGDPVKTLQLLWGMSQTPKRGPKPKVSVQDIVAAAIHVADTDGLDAVSTRRVAEAVGISPMSFYTHIPGKAELIDLMVDAASGLVQEERPLFDPEKWRDNVAFIARGYRDFFLQHPWLLELATHRPGLGPNTLAAYEIALTAVDGLGLDEIEMDMMVTLIGNYVYGAVRHAARAKKVEKLTGMSDEEWWYRILPFLDAIDYSPYPVASRVGPVTGEAYGVGDPERAFDFGLDVLLDGMAVFIGKRQPKKQTGG